MFGYGAVPFAAVINVDGAFTTQRINDVHFGSWWIGVGSILMGAMGLVANNSFGVQLTIAISILALFVTIAGKFSIKRCKFSNLIYISSIFNHLSRSHS